MEPMRLAREESSRELRAVFGAEMPSAVQPEERVTTDQKALQRTGDDPTGPDLAGPDIDKRFPLALAMYAALAVLVWFTMDAGKVLVFGKPVELRLVPLIVIGGLALRTVLARQAERIRRGGEKDGWQLSALSYQLLQCWIGPTRLAPAGWSWRLRADGWFWGLRADVAQLVEHSLGKGEVTSSILVISSRSAGNRDQGTGFSGAFGEKDETASSGMNKLIPDLWPLITVFRRE
jgi:hypothetical protein